MARGHRRTRVSGSESCLVVCGLGLSLVLLTGARVAQSTALASDDRAAAGAATRSTHDCGGEPCAAVARGFRAFFDRQLEGLSANGRACTDCHMPTDSFQLSPARAEARLQLLQAGRRWNRDADDPLFRKTLYLDSGNLFEPGFGSFGNTDDQPPPFGHLEREELNRPPVVESADTSPLFHNHGAEDRAGIERCAGPSSSPLGQAAPSLDVERFLPATAAHQGMIRSTSRGWRTSGSPEGGAPMDCSRQDASPARVESETFSSVGSSSSETAKWARELRCIARRARNAGITLESERHDTEWNSRAFEVGDPSGFLLTIFSETPA